MSVTLSTKKKNRIREGSKAADVMIYAVAALFALISLYPLYYVLILSLSSPENAITMQVYWWPKGLYLDGYKRILTDTKLWIAYRNTIFYAATQMVCMLVICSMAAYTLSSKHLKGRKFLNFYLLVPMYFSGGIIPLFLLMIRLGIYDTPWALILPGSFNIWYIILIKSYFSTIPESLIGVWNGWYRASIFLANSNLQPLQLYLRKVLVEQSIDLSQEFLTAEELLQDQKERLSNNQLKYTIIIISSLPMLIAYPYFQKFFVKGVMMGSLKE